MGIETKIHCVTDNYKIINVTCNTEEEYSTIKSKHAQWNENAIKEGYFGAIVKFSGEYYAKIFRKIDEDLTQYNQELRLKEFKSEHEAAKIIIR